MTKKKKNAPPGRLGGFGRRKGVPNRATAEMKTDLRRFLEDPAYQNNVMKRIEKGKAPLLEKYFWEVVYGKPKVVMEVSTPGRTVSLVQALESLTMQERRTLADLTRKAIQGALVVDVKALPSGS